MYMQSKESSKEIKNTINLFEKRIQDLEKTIKKESNQGIKKIMQENYVLNSSLLKMYKGMDKDNQ